MKYIHVHAHDMYTFYVVYVQYLWAAMLCALFIHMAVEVQQPATDVHISDAGSDALAGHRQRRAWSEGHPSKPEW